MAEPTPGETLAAVLALPQYDEIATVMSNLRKDYFDTPLFAHIDGLAQIMPRLKAAGAAPPPAEEADPAPDPEE